VELSPRGKTARSRRRKDTAVSPPAGIKVKVIEKKVNVPKKKPTEPEEDNAESDGSGSNQ